MKEKIRQRIISREDQERMSMEKVPPPEEWLSAKKVASMFSVSVGRVYYAHEKGRRNASGNIVKLEMFKTFSGLATTKDLVEEFLMKLNG